MLALFAPLLGSGKLGYPLNWRGLTILTWAGLRGAVGLVRPFCLCLTQQ